MEPARLVASDLDGTFIGDDEAMLRLWDAIDGAGLTLAFSTGRHLKSIRNFYAEHEVDRRADVCVCMVGTDVWFLRGDKYEIDRGWHEEISWRWDKEAVEAILADIPEVRRQDVEWQSPFKSSYYLEANAPERLDEIRRRLDDKGLEAKVVYSADKFLDLLPAKSGKGEAVRHVAETLGIEPANVVTCGDTGNDIDMMRPELGFHSIIVGNAAPELKAIDGDRIYHADDAYAAGIYEGLKTLGWI